MHDDLWSFATGLYAAQGVADACLALQDGYGQDVLLLMHAAWRAARGEVLQPGDAHRADRAVSAWRSEVVEPLRGVRRRMKHGPAPAPCAATEALRASLKAVELDAERIALAMLETVPVADAVQQAPSLALATANLCCAAGEGGDRRRQELIAVIAAAVPLAGCPAPSPP